MAKPTPEATAADTIPAQPATGIKESELPGVHDPSLEWTLKAGNGQNEADEAKIKSLQETYGRLRVKPDTDRTTVTPEMRKAYGIADSRTCVWKLNPAIPQWKALQGNQSLDHWLNTVPESEVVIRKTEDGKSEPVLNGDMILCTYPDWVDKAFERYQQEQQEKMLEDTDTGDYHADEIGEGRYRNTQEELEGMRRREMTVLPESGMLGEWKKQPLEKILTMLGPEECKEIAREYRGSYAEIDPVITEAAKKVNQERGGGGGKTISIPANVRPRNFAGAKK